MTAATPLDLEPANDSARRPRRKFILGSHVEIAEALLETIHSDAAPVTALGALHTYDKSTGTWAAETREALVKRISQGFDGCMVLAQEEDKPKPLRLRESDVMGSMRIALALAHVADFFSAAVPGFAFSNGFVKVTKEGAELGPHSPDHRARFSYPFAYDARASRERWMACLREVFRDDADAEEKIAFLQEFAGASLCGIATSYQKCAVLFGQGGNGKGAVCKTIAAGMPKGSVCAIEPQSWGSEYRRALLAGHLFNMVSEMPEADILDGDDFKNMITGEPSTARQPAQPAFTFSPVAGHMFSANKLPGSNDPSFGFWRRMTVIEFNRKFSDGEAVVDLDKLIVATELPGVVAWMIEGAVRLMQRGRYTVVPSSAAAVAAWKRSADPVQTFVDEKTRPAKHDDERTSGAELYSAYREWAERGGFKARNKNSFGREMTRVLDGKADHTDTGAAYAVVMLEIGERNPHFAEQALADAARKEGASARAPEPAQPPDDPDSFGAWVDKMVPRK
jgi:P4 family phage/plasmid primase-like protien